MPNTILLTPILVSFLVTLLFIPYWIKRAKLVGLTGKDVNKSKKEVVSESGGITVLAGFVFGVLIYVTSLTFLLKVEENTVKIFALLNVIIIVSLIGFVDDIFGWKIGLNKKTRFLTILLASIPLIAINAGRSIISLPFNGQTDLGIFYPLILIPLGIAGATLAFNMLAGMNGLEAGQGIILLSALAIVSYFTGSPWLAVISLCMVASLVSFLIFNFYPAKVFPGDSLTYSVGALIAIISILGSFEKVAVFFFIPYILEVIIKSRGKLRIESFALPKSDGSLALKNPKIHSLTHLSIYLMQSLKIKPTEKKVVYSIWAFQIIIIVLGFIIFKQGIFLN
ncbi:glycosyl transferase family 4 [Candidatus Pacearchaeota archaeon]|nr:glycosyl transferase family 4 [Candidatus Pacearchaeota archaeon]|tara:strand:+ start:4916 stop:5929 length:1014 start_codon:yes stop_codon:yes gene_type:complete